MRRPQPRRGQSAAIKAWFILDAVVALAPPLYWAADGSTKPILGLPAALFYFLAVGTCIAASVVVAYFDDRARGEFAQ
jgi:hypothetical protein